HGRMRRVTLGRLGMLTADQAREEASRMAADISQGTVPERLRKRRTFGDLADLYLEHHAPVKRSARNDRAVLRNHLIGWRARALSEITRQDLERLHAELGRTAPYQANRAVALVRKMFNLALGWGMFVRENPVTALRQHPEVTRQGHPFPGEFPRGFGEL